jgi:cell division septation protein DedD
MAWSHSGGAEKRVCILPFTNRTQSEGLAARVREGFFGRLALKRFADVELRELDARLETLPEAWSQLSPRRLGQALQCDALVYGEITEASNLYLGVYAQLTLEGKIQFVDASSNETLVIGSHATKFRTGGVPFSLLEVVPNAVLNLRNFTSEQSLRAVDDLARNLADKIPDLPTSVAENPVAATPANTPEGREQRKVKTPVITTAAPSRYRVQVAAFSKPGEARHVAQRLRDEGFRPMVVTATTDEHLWHKVLLGPFPSLDIAQETGVRVRQRLHISPMIVRMQ